MQAVLKNLHLHKLDYVSYASKKSQFLYMIYYFLLLICSVTGNCASDRQLLHSFGPFVPPAHMFTQPQPYYKIFFLFLKEFISGSVAQFNRSPKSNREVASLMPTLDLM